MPAALTQQKAAAVATSSGPLPVADDPYLADVMGPRKWVSSAPATCDAFSEAPDVLARCQALQAVSEFNQVLLRFDSGESAEALKGQISNIKGILDGLTNLAAVTPAAPFLTAGKVLFGPLSNILGEALTLRERAILRAKLNEGAPLVAEILTRLRSDARTIFYAQYDETRRLLGAERSIALEGATDMLSIAGQHQAPTGTMLAPAGELAQRYEAALDKLGARPATLVPLDKRYGVRGNAPLTPEELDLMSTDVKKLEGAASRHEALVKAWKDFSAALTQYDAMLAAVEQSLETLVARSNDPFAPGGGTARLLESLTAVRDHAREIDRLIGTL